MTTRVVPSRSLSVVIPAFNEERRLPATLREVHSYLCQDEYDFELLVVDDGSYDGTRQASIQLESELPMLRTIGYAVNRGKGYAVRTGVLSSTRDAILFMDADHSTPIAEIESLWPLLGRGYDVAIGSRRMQGSRSVVRQPAHRILMGRIFHEIISVAGLRGIQDSQCGFKLFRREVAIKLFSTLKTYGFAFDVEILLRARQLGYRLAEIGVQWVNSSDCRVNALRDSARMFLEVLRM